MNFVFISPNFPRNYYNYCKGLKENGANVLGVGDEPYDELAPELKSALTEYFKVNSLENYDEVYRAVAFFAWKYGKIDWLDSNNEYWLEKDAYLRTDFNINTGIKADQIGFIKYKSQMKAFYEKAGVAVARYHLTTTLEEGKKFIEKVGYPVIVKPDNGVGAARTWKIKNDADLEAFYAEPQITQMIMEEFINGDLISYDGIADSNRDVILETHHVFPVPIMEVVNNNLDCYYWNEREIPEDLRDIGRRVIKAFPTNSRFFHCEYFRLREDKEGLGKKGDILGLEVNMRSPGGPTPDMMNFASDIDVFKVWANMVCYDEALVDTTNKKYYVAYAGRRDDHQYERTTDEVAAMYEGKLVMNQRVPAVIAGAMGDWLMMARFETKDEALAFIKNVCEKYCLI